MHFDSGNLTIWATHLRELPSQVMAEAFRRAAQGERVAVVQLLRGGIGQGPDRPVRLLENLSWYRPAIGRAIDCAGTDEEILCVQVLWEHLRSLLDSFDLLVISEAGLAHKFGLLAGEQLFDLVHSRPDNLDLVLSGPSLPEALVPLADQWIVQNHRRGDPPCEGLGPVAVHPTVTSAA